MFYELKKQEQALDSTNQFDSDWILLSPTYYNSIAGLTQTGNKQLPWEITSVYVSQGKKFYDIKQGSFGLNVVPEWYTISIQDIRDEKLTKLLEL
jgi:hypothetical protein